jgi:hypothetical protein
MPEKPVKRRLKLILVFRSVPNDDIELRELLERFGLIERFTPYVSGGRGAVRGDEARSWLTERRNEAIAEVTLVVAAVAMLAAIVAAVRRQEAANMKPCQAAALALTMWSPAN